MISLRHSNDPYFLDSLFFHVAFEILVGSQDPSETKMFEGGVKEGRSKRIMTASGGN